MDATYQSTQNQNVTNNERALRVVLGMGLLTAIIIGIFTAPATIFGLSMASIYLVFTTILGIDPVYILIQRLARQLPVSRHDAGQACA